MQNNKNQNLKYLVSNPIDDLWGLYATTVGFQSSKPNSNYPPKEHPTSYWFNPKNGRFLHEYQILYILSGEGTFESSSCKSTKIIAGNIIFLFPEEWHTYKPSNKVGWDEYWIGFNGKYIDQLNTNDFISKENPIINIGFNEEITSLFKRAIEIASYQRIAFQQYLAGIITHIISKIYYTEKNKAFRDKEITILIEKARMIMRLNIEENLSPEKIATTLGISYSWFRRIFKQYTGFSPAQYQIEIKIQDAKDLLNSTSMSVKEISYKLNFISCSYFVTFFKTRAGISPTEYRKKNYKKNL